MKFLIMVFALVISCQTVEYVKEVDEKNSVYYLHTHEEHASTDIKRKEALQKAQQSLLTTHRSRPRDVKILLDLAQVSFLLGEYDSSIRFCRSVLKLDLSSRQARLILIKSFLKQKKI